MPATAVTATVAKEASSPSQRATALASEDDVRQWQGSLTRRIELVRRRGRTGAAEHHHDEEEDDSAP
jgi:hypothetical protein